jgi:hypothetical protein
LQAKRTRKHSAQPTARSFPPACSSSRERKNNSPPVAPSPHQQRRSAEISIAFLPHRPPAAPPSRYLLTRFRALALFGRRSPERVVRSSLPAAENLHNSGCEQTQQKIPLLDHLVGKRE